MLRKHITHVNDMVWLNIVSWYPNHEIKERTYILEVDESIANAVNVSQTVIHVSAVTYLQLLAKSMRRYMKS